MKTPTVDDKRPKRDNLGPTGPAVVDKEKTSEKDNAGSASGGDGSYEKEIEHILDRKRGQTPPG